jgi:ketosteroid isomerase-like protein
MADCHRCDEADILRTVAEYCRAVDERGGAGLADLFTSDASFTIMGATFRGQAEIAARLSGDTRGLIHLAANPIISVDGDSASGTVEHLLLRRGADGSLTIFAVGRWVDRYVRGPDRWLLAERAVESPFGEPPRPAATADPPGP